MAMSKKSVWGEDGRISPLTLEAMQRKGALAHELEPIRLPEEQSQVARVRYDFLEEKRAGMWLPGANFVRSSGLEGGFQSPF